MIIHSSIFKTKIITTVIAPHGITNLIHGIQANKLKPLIAINSICISGSVLSHNYNNFNDIIFLLGSVVHFRHDFKFLTKNQQIKTFCSIFMIFLFLLKNDLFFPYMTLLHVPNHYKNNWIYIKQNKIRNLAIILSFTILSTLLGNEVVFYTDKFYQIYKGIIISHIIYEEYFVHNSTLLS